MGINYYITLAIIENTMPFSRYISSLGVGNLLWNDIMLLHQQHSIL